MRFAYADPPYYGCGKKHYAKHHKHAADYDRLETHAALIARLVDEFPDGWAMSLRSTTLSSILPLCPADVRVGAWVKPFASFKPGVNPAYTWEPVIFRGGRVIGRDVATVRDFVEQSADAVKCNITLKKGLVGAKPEKVCHWIFAFLGMRAGDTLVDLFPGTGAVGRAWERYISASEMSGSPLFAKVSA